MLAFASEVHCKVQGVLRHARQYLPGNRMGTTTAAAARAPQQQQQQHERVRLAVVGDVHGQWSPADAAALQALRADAVLWVGECAAAIQPAGLRSTSFNIPRAPLARAGDIGNEDVGLVQQIAALVSQGWGVRACTHDQCSCYGRPLTSCSVVHAG